MILVALRLNRGHGIDMNVQPAWQEGIIGRGVVVTILDDGLEKDHPDLARNYDPQASYDVNNHDENPMPRYDLLDSNRHGTRCAGEVTCVINNVFVLGVRMLDGDVTDAVEARSLSLNPQHIDIYSASWGPDDDGKTVDGPGELATRAFIEGVTRGRSGKGSIFVWASGNGGRDHDNCNCDGYTNSIWTLSISSATEAGRVPWYSEACSSTLATTYSSGSPGEKQVVTTDLHHSCTSGHTGTSASAPLAAGICALALEANKGLTWRDMQHIVVRTAKPANLRSPDWTVNGVGRNVSHSFGYGLMDASAMVKLARIWKTVPEQHKCEVSAPHADKLIPAKSQVILQLTVKECAGVNFLEHVQAKISLASSRRGDLQIHLTSPSGTRSTLLALRPHDISRTGFQSWPFMSVHTWGEQPFGVWQLEIHNEGRFLGRATLLEWALIFYGTAATPEGQDSPSQTIPPQRSHNRVVLAPSRPVPASIPIAIYPITTRKNKYTPRKNGSTKTTVKHAPLLVNSSRESTVKTSRPSVIEIRRPTMSTLTRMRVKSTTLTSNKPVISNTQTPIPFISSTWTGTQTDMIIDSQTHSPNAINGELTIFLEPHPSDSHPRVPDVFRKYHKVQSLYPMYPGSSSKFGQSSFRPALPNLVSSSDLLQDETPTRNKGTGKANNIFL
uniref:furin n=1 Tax=Timema californicum TaxID=61474 RepID=A0A7R9IVX1_TIMCA|nr:unnamed protein product [Timema californicum]